ncbi:MAG: hypothetical protein U1F33_15595 [Alphaproteobacteria bacterium]
MTPIAPASEDGDAWRLRRRVPLSAPLRRTELAAIAPRVAPSAPQPARIVLWDEVVWGEVAPSLWVAPAEAIIVGHRGRRRLAARGRDRASPSTLH